MNQLQTLSILFLFTANLGQIGRVNAQVDPDVVVEPVIDTVGGVSGFSSLINSLHATTSSDLIRREVNRTNIGADTLHPRFKAEFERNLRALVPFRAASIETADSTELNVKVADSWSLLPEPFHLPGEDSDLVLLREHNLFGTGRSFGVGTDLARSNRSGRRFLVQFSDPELVHSPLKLRSSLLVGEDLIDLELGIQRAFASDFVSFVFGAEGRLTSGREFLYFGDPGADRTKVIVDTTEGVSFSGSAWVGSASTSEDLFVGSAALHLEQSSLETPPPPIERAFSNTIGLFAGIQSLRRDYQRYENFDATGERFEPTGGSGRVSIGKFFSVGGGSDNLLYIGAGASQSIGGTDGFVHLRIDAGTALRDRETELTMLHGGSSGGVQIGPGALAFTSEFQIVWRWPRYLFQPAASSRVPLRGFNDLDLFADNHFATSIEYRFLPGHTIGPWDVSATLFHDMAGYWNGGSEFSDTRFHHSVGAGIRFGHRDGPSRPILRIDIPYNFDRREIIGIDIGISEAFDLFGSLKYLPPGPLRPNR